VTNYLKTIKALSSIEQRQSGLSIHKERVALDPEVVLLRDWQVNRLSETYSDLLRESRYSLTGRFFLNNIYAPKDFSQRDNDLEYLYDLMSSVLPKFLLSLVDNTIKLNNLTNILDYKLLHAMVEELDMKEEITPEMYTEGYRICDNYDERYIQIELILEIGRQVDLGRRIPFAGTALRLARGPAHRSGWGDVHDFLEDGFNAFKNMRGAKKFLRIVKIRELYILNRIFEGDPNPFESVPN
jgi:hypothetical protein